MISPESLAFFQSFFKKRSGYILGDDKAYLLHSKLDKILPEKNLADMDALARYLKTQKDEEFEEKIVQTMTVNETLFFRDNKPFKFFTESFLPEILARKTTNKTLRIWCAACSSGQEPYSLAMLIEDQISKFHDWKISILASDICGKVLDEAYKGEYSDFKVRRGVSEAYLDKYFEKSESGNWLISSTLRNHIYFQQFNLLDEMNILGKFDLIFCRNVLIYFDLETKRDIVERMKNQLTPGGALILGSAETMNRLSDSFENTSGYAGIYTAKTALELKGQAC